MKSKMTQKEIDDYNYSYMLELNWNENDLKKAKSMIKDWEERKCDNKDKLLANFKKTQLKLQKECVEFWEKKLYEDKQARNA